MQSTTLSVCVSLSPAPGGGLAFRSDSVQDGAVCPESLRGHHSAESVCLEYWQVNTATSNAQPKTHASSHVSSYLHFSILRNRSGIKETMSVTSDLATWCLVINTLTCLTVNCNVRLRYGVLTEFVFIVRIFKCYACMVLKKKKVKKSTISIAPVAWGQVKSHTRLIKSCTLLVKTN